MMDFEEWYKSWEDVQQDGRLSYDTRQGAEEAWDYQEQRIAELEAHHRWRPVDEYPTESGLYIATDGDMVSAAYFGVGDSTGIPYWSNDGYLSEDITHWMPMPEPPLEDG